MLDDVRIAFERRVIAIHLADILPSKMLPRQAIESAKYKRIAASVAHIGLVEPLVVARQEGGKYLLLDGHVRLVILKELGSADAKCVIADDDEGFTYNKRVNRLATIQEHYMIVRALERGVSEVKLAEALNVDVKIIRHRRNLLSGISPDAVDVLKDKPVGTQAFQRLRKMKPIRQLEVSELMVSANNYSANYVKALLATTKPHDLHKPDDLKKATGLSPEQMSRLEREMSSFLDDYKELESSYGDDMLVLVVAVGFIERLLSKPEIERFLSLKYSEFLDPFRGIIQAASLDQTAAA